jgi:mannose-6-phosphate isomerase-like protein (cupin superfamily)
MPAVDQELLLRPHRDEYYFEEGCYIWEIANSTTDPLLSVARARVAPQGETRWHRLHAVAERYLVLSGQGLVQLGCRPPRAQRVAAGDQVFIPPGCPQRIRNTGSGDLVFLALCTPRFRPEVYEDLGTGTSPSVPT